MLISTKKKFVFIANLKTASTAIETVLQPYCEIALITSEDGKHLTFAEVEQIYGNILSERQRFFIFGVMRNPVEYILSLYNSHIDVKFLNTRLYTGDMDFDHFLADWTAANADQIVAQYTRFLDRNGKIGPNYIISYANLMEGLKYVASVINLPDLLKVPLDNVSPKRLLRNDLSEMQLAWISTRFQEDDKFIAQFCDRPLADPGQKFFMSSNSDSEVTRKEMFRKALQLSPDGSQNGHRSSIAACISVKLFGKDVLNGYEAKCQENLQGRNSDHPIFKQLMFGHRPHIVFDVGVWKGGSTIVFADLLKQLEIDGAVIAIDTFLGSPEDWMGEKQDEIFSSLRFRHGYPHLYWQFLSNIKHRQCEEYVVPLAQTTENAARILTFHGIKADLIHIDAAHEYDAVLRDALSYWPLLNPGGYLVGDDYHHSWPGVISAAQDFARRTGVELDLYEPKWVVRKPAAGLPDDPQPATVSVASTASPEELVTAAYKAILGRPPDAGGLRTYRNLFSGVTPAQGVELTVGRLLKSKEFEVKRSSAAPSESQPNPLTARFTPAQVRWASSFEHPNTFLIAIFRAQPDSQPTIHVLNNSCLAAPRMARSIEYIDRLISKYILSADCFNLYEDSFLPTKTGELFCTFQIEDCPETVANTLVYCGFGQNTNLVPDIHFWQTKGYFQRRQEFNKAWVPWKERAPVAFWRGSSTGALDVTMESFPNLPRFHLCSVSTELGGLLDAKLTDIVQARNTDETLKIREFVQGLGLWSSHVPQTEFLKYRFQIDIDGNSNSWSFLLKLLMGSCVLKISSRWRQWYYGDLQPWVHYVPVKNDLSDLEERVAWCLENDDDARTIAEAGMTYARGLVLATEMPRAAGEVLKAHRAMTDWGP